MINNQAQFKILAQAVYEIRLLLSGYLGGQNPGDPSVRRAAHLSYALHNEALAVLNGSSFDVEMALHKIQAVDNIFQESYYAPRFAAHMPDQTRPGESGAL